MGVVNTALTATDSTGQDTKEVTKMSYMGKFGINDDGHSIQDDTGSIIFYHGEAERKIARQTVEDHLAKLESKIEQRLGRKITVAEARKGLQRQPLTSQEQVRADLTWQSMIAESKVKDQSAVNPHQRRLDEYEREQRKAEDPKKFQIEEDLRLWNEKQAEQKRKDDLINDPHRQRALKIAQTALLESKYNERVSAGTLDVMERLVSYIRSGGDLEKARQIQYVAGQQVVADLEIKTQFAQTQIAEYQQQQKKLSEKFNLPTAPVGTVVTPTETSV